MGVAVLGCLFRGTGVDGVQCVDWEEARGEAVGREQQKGMGRRRRWWWWMGSRPWMGTWW